VYVCACARARPQMCMCMRNTQRRARPRATYPRVPRVQTPLNSYMHHVYGPRFGVCMHTATSMREPLQPRLFTQLPLALGEVPSWCACACTRASRRQRPQAGDPRSAQRGRCLASGRCGRETDARPTPRGGAHGRTRPRVGVPGSSIHPRPCGRPSLHAQSLLTVSSASFSSHSPCHCSRTVFLPHTSHSATCTRGDGPRQHAGVQRPRPRWSDGAGMRMGPAPGNTFSDKFRGPASWWRVRRPYREHGEQHKSLHEPSAAWRTRHPLTRGTERPDRPPNAPLLHAHPGKVGIQLSHQQPRV
jgi:hypothetical protein